MVEPDLVTTALAFEYTITQLSGEQIVLQHPWLWPQPYLLNNICYIENALCMEL